MTREKSLEIIKEIAANYISGDHKYKTVEVIEAIDTYNDTIDQLKKARKAARRYKRMYLRLKNSEKIVEE